MRKITLEQIIKLVDATEIEIDEWEDEKAYMLVRTMGEEEKAIEKYGKWEVMEIKTTDMVDDMIVIVVKSK